MAARNTVLQIVSGDLWGGAESQVLCQSRALRTAGWDVQLLAFGAGEAFEKYRAAGIPSHLACEAEGLPRFVRSALQQVAAIRPVIVLAHGYKEAFVAYLARLAGGTPWIATLHGAAEPARGVEFLKSRLYLASYSALARLSAARIIAVSPAVARAWGVERLHKLRVVRNVAEAAPSASNASAGARQRVSRVPSIICVGRLARVKRFDLAIEALAHLQRVHGAEGASLTIVGEGQERSALELLTRELGCSESVRFLGFRRDVNALLNRADVLLITSTNEGLPTVLLEALLAGLPIVSTDVGGIRDVLQHFPGYPFTLVPTHHPHAVSDALKAMWETSAAGLDLDREATLRTFRRHFAPEAAAKQLSEVFCEVLNRS